MFCTSATRRREPDSRRRALLQLQTRFDDLIAAPRADGMAARLEAAERCERQVAAQADAALGCVVEAFAGLRKAGRFERQGRHDRVRVVQLEEIDVVVTDAALVSIARCVELVTAVKIERIGAPRERERRSRDGRAGDSHAVRRAQRRGRVRRGEDERALEPLQIGETSNRRMGSVMTRDCRYVSRSSALCSSAFGFVSGVAVRGDRKRREVARARRRTLPCRRASRCAFSDKNDSPQTPSSSQSAAVASARVTMSRSTCVIRSTPQTATAS